MSTASTRTILIIKTGTTEPKVVDQFGDYDEWFRAVLAYHKSEIILCQAWQNEPLPDPQQFDGIILTGSPASVRDDETWMTTLGEWTIQAASLKVPVLAVCFGHQLAGEALGGRVEINPAGPEYGTIEVALTTAGKTDPLFIGIPPIFHVQSTHRDSLTESPDAVLLASTPNTKWQAFRWGGFLRAVQFHPEIPAAALQALCQERGIEAQVQPQCHGFQILTNWLSHCLK